MLPKSLFWKILRITYLKSRFCVHRPRHARTKSNRMNILRIVQEKKWGGGGTSLETRRNRKSGIFNICVQRAWLSEPLSGKLRQTLQR